MEGKKRSISKTISWRVIAFTTNVTLFYLFTRELTLSLAFGGVGVLVKTLFYYIHERVWNKTSWGRAQ